MEGPPNALAEVKLAGVHVADLHTHPSPGLVLDSSPPHSVPLAFATLHFFHFPRAFFPARGGKILHVLRHCNMLLMQYRMWSGLGNNIKVFHPLKTIDLLC